VQIMIGKSTSFQIVPTPNRKMPEDIGFVR